MKQWTEEDLILLFYGELSVDQANQLNQVLAGSTAQSNVLRTQYEALKEALGPSLEFDVPAPSSGLNDRIMAAVNVAECDKQERLRSIATVEPEADLSAFSRVSQRLAGWFAIPRGQNTKSAFAFTFFVLVGIFYIGRWSAGPVSMPIVTIDKQAVDQQGRRSGQELGRRVLLTNVSAHIESGQRLLTLVINGGENIAQDIEPRRQMIEDLISFNRLYRRMAEQKNDAMLVAVLQQMESTLLEINHTSSDVADWQRLQRRLADRDLLFKLKVVDNKINRELI